MAQQTMSEKDMYAGTFENEYQTTLRLLKAFPTDKPDLKPHERSKSARELAWMLVLNQMVVTPVIETNELMPGSFPPAPATFHEIIPAFEQAHRDAVAKIQKLKDEDLNKTIRMPTGPKQLGDVRRGNALWMFLSDTIHHRGQLSVYLRMAGGKVPSIYGPTADEPWI